jgi:hypothetical protein
LFSLSANAELRHRLSGNPAKVEPAKTCLRAQNPESTAVVTGQPPARIERATKNAQQGEEKAIKMSQPQKNHQEIIQEQLVSSAREVSVDANAFGIAAQQAIMETWQGTKTVSEKLALAGGALGIVSLLDGGCLAAASSVLLLAGGLLPASHQFGGNSSPERQ